jgi:hypothetical protein
MMGRHVHRKCLWFGTCNNHLFFFFFFSSLTSTPTKNHTNPYNLCFFHTWSLLFLLLFFKNLNNLLNNKCFSISPIVFFIAIYFAWDYFLDCFSSIISSSLGFFSINFFSYFFIVIFSTLTSFLY